MEFIKSTLGEIALEIKTGKTPPTSNPEYFGDELNWYTPTDLDREKILGDSKRRITQKALNDKKVVLLKPNTILLGCIGDIGKIGLIKESASSNQQITGILPKEEIVNSEFLYYWLQNNKNRLRDTSTSAIVPILNNKQLSTIKIEFPKLIEDQIRIAEILSQAENLITQRKESILLLDELLKSTFLEMFGNYYFTGNLMKLNDLCYKITDGTHDTPIRLTEGIKFITGKHIRPFVIDYENSDYVTTEVHEEIYKRCNPEYGDILYTNIGVNLGTSAMNVVNYEFSMKNVALLKPKREKINSRYLEHILNNDRQKNKIINDNSTGGAQKFLSLGQIKSIKIPVPPIEIQNKFAHIVEKVEVLKKEYQTSLVELENMYGVLSQKAFKGELDLKK